MTVQVTIQLERRPMCRFFPFQFTLLTSQILDQLQLASTELLHSLFRMWNEQVQTTLHQTCLERRTYNYYSTLPLAGLIPSLNRASYQLLLLVVVELIGNWDTLRYTMLICYVGTLRAQMRADVTDGCASFRVRVFDGVQVWKGFQATDSTHIITSLDTRTTCPTQ